MERQRIVERDDFTIEEREDILAKSGGKCAHCGKEIFVGYGATVDHFIPLSKGGTNRMINLIPLCFDCNQKKNRRIMPPENYIKYLSEKHTKDLTGYFESYVMSFDYLSRRNLLVCDQYEIDVCPGVVERIQNPKKQAKARNAIKNTYYLTRADENDFDKICDYMSKYFKKYGVFNSEDNVVRNVKFWYKFGCIYYVEKDNEIKCVSTFTIHDYSHFLKDAKPDVSINLFSYYSKPISGALASGIVEMIPKYIMREQNIPTLNIRINVLKADSLYKYILQGHAVEECENDDFAHGYFNINNKRYIYKTENKEKEKTDGQDAFFKKFKDDYEEIKEYLNRDKCKDILWMMDECYERSNEERVADRMAIGIL